jgi:hypothetical protein
MGRMEAKLTLLFLVGLLGCSVVFALVLSMMNNEIYVGVKCG